MEGLLNDLEKVETTLKKIRTENRKLPDDLHERLFKCQKELRKQQFTLLKFLVKQCVALGFTSKEKYIIDNGPMAVFFDGDGSHVKRYQYYLHSEYDWETLREWFDQITKFYQWHNFYRIAKTMIGTITEKVNQNKSNAEDLKKLHNELRICLSQL